MKDKLNSETINFALQKQQYKQLCLYHSNITAMVKNSEAVNMIGMEKGGEGKGREGRGEKDAGGRGESLFALLFEG